MRPRNDDADRRRIAALYLLLDLIHRLSEAFLAEQPGCKQRVQIAQAFAVAFAGNGL